MLSLKKPTRNRRIARCLARAVLLAFVLTVSGCSAERNTRTTFPTSNEWNQVRAGMTESEVIQHLGRPFDTMVDSFPDGRVSRVRLQFSTYVDPRQNHVVYEVVLGPHRRVVEVRKGVMD